MIPRVDPSMPDKSDTVDTLLAALDKLALWQRFIAASSPEQQATVKHLLGHADALLSRVVETFPTYTLHDRTHAINVANLMGKLTEPRLEEMNALEAGLLLLSAFWHDVGMVFTEEERATIQETEEFQEFLRTHPEAHLEMAEDRLSRAVMEWFCRWRHAERVFHHLDQVEDRLVWDAIPLRQQLGDLCRSHNLDAAALKDDELTPTDYQGTADVRFLAVLLRLADILDFDRTRAPEAIYRYLGLGRRPDARKQASDVEWHKHLASKGFGFPKPDERRAPYSVTFVASPDDPAVEWDVRQFLDVIEGELLSCQQLLRTCSLRWQDVSLPNRVDRKLYGKNYKFGDYRFLLDQEQVLGLLMGENLYENPYAFVRELLQNALDTSRHREFYERAQGRADFQCEPIVVSEWYDNEQYHWVRFDDFGMGMTEEIIRNFLLRVGRSYYTSAEFKAEQLQYQTQQSFTPISRFGIGLLSCFIAGARVEITTRHALSAKAEAGAIRLSLSGLHGFFTLQSGKHIPNRMPGLKGDEPGYRSAAGTSIAVRLDPMRQRELLDLGRVLEKCILYPPVPIHFNGSAIGGDATLLNHPWLDHPIDEILDDSVTQHFVRTLLADPSTRISLRVTPLDLTSHAPVDELRGQLLLVFLDVQSNASENESASGILRHYRLESLSPAGLGIVSDLDLGSARGTKQSKPAADIFKRLRSKGSSSSVRHATIRVETPATIRAALGRWMRGIFLSHNGIQVDSFNSIDESLSIFRRQGHQWQLFGTLALSDGLRPDLSISRETLKSLPWNICLAVELAYAKALREVGANNLSDMNSFRLIKDSLPDRRNTILGEVVKEPLLRREGPWHYEPLFQVALPTALKSAQDLYALMSGQADSVPLSTSLSLPGYFGRSFSWGALEWTTHTLVISVILQRDFQCTFSVKSGYIDISDVRNTPLTAGESLFPPLTFIPFTDSRVLRHGRYWFVNTNHPFSTWLLAISPRLAQRYPGFFDSIRTQLAVSPGDITPIEKWVRDVNAILDRLTAIDPELGPPSSLRLAPVDVTLAQ
jgi:hypothetical protein